MKNKISLASLAVCLLSGVSGMAQSQVHPQSAQLTYSARYLANKICRDLSDPTREAGKTICDGVVKSAAKLGYNEKTVKMVTECLTQFADACEKTVMQDLQ